MRRFSAFDTQDYNFSVERKHYTHILTFIVVGVAYFATARFGLTLNAVSGFATLVWAPSGIALASLFLLGYRFWPAVLVAAFMVNVATGATPAAALGIGAGNTLEPLIGTYLLKRLIRFEPSMERVRDVFGLVLLAAMLSTTVSATIGVSSLWFAHIVPTKVYGTTWLAWWVGDMLGAIVIAPLILVWSRRIKGNLRLRPLLEASVYLLALTAISTVVFRGVPSIGIKPFTFIYLIFPLLIWIALRFGQLGSVTATFVTSATAIWGTVTSRHSSVYALTYRLLLLQIFMGITVVTFMTMAAVVSEREQSQRQKQLLTQRAELLAKQRTRLLALNKAKDDFIALASHQLRTPATIVKVYTSMLMTGHAGTLTKAQTELLRTAYQGNERQLELIDALLRVARLDTGAIVLKKEKVDLALLVEEVIASYNGNLAVRQQTVQFRHTKRHFVADIDREKVRIALENILDNASKYSPPGKHIAIRLHQRQSHLAVSVHDKGVGIVRKDMQKLFKKFSRIDNPLSTSANGTGLGLYWANKIIAMHQGSIEVTSTPKKGSTFTVVLPSEDK